MARGWESKSVEEQQSEFQKGTSASKPSSPEERRREQQVQTFKMQRARVRDQLKDSQNPRFIELLQRELQHLDAEIKKLAES